MYDVLKYTRGALSPSFTLDVLFRHVIDANVSTVYQTGSKSGVSLFIVGFYNFRCVFLIMGTTKISILRFSSFYSRPFREEVIESW